MLFKFFDKLGNGKKSAAPEDRLSDCLRRKDFAGLARAYYDMGVSAMDRGDLNRAALWLHRADTIYSARDEIYEAVGDQVIDDCSSRIGTLEDAPLLHNTVPAEAEEKAEALNDQQLRLWGLLAAARMVKLGGRLAALPGCEALGRLEWAVEVMLKSFQEPVAQEEYDGLMDICNSLYEMGDAEAFFAGGEIPVSGGAPFQVFDLNGMMGVHLGLNGYIDNHLRFLAALSQGAEPPAAGSEMVGCTLLPDYYVRAGADRPEEVPQVKAELARIWSDYDFVRTGLTWEQVSRRMKAYEDLDILAV